MSARTTTARTLINEAVAAEDEDRLVQILFLCALSEEDLKVDQHNVRNVFNSIAITFEYRDRPILAFIDALSPGGNHALFATVLRSEKPFFVLVNRCSEVVIRKVIERISDWGRIHTIESHQGKPVEICATMAISYERFLLFAPLWNHEKNGDNGTVIPLFFCAIDNPLQTVAKAIIQWAFDAGVKRTILRTEMRYYGNVTPALYAMSKGKMSLVPLLTPLPRSIQDGVTPQPP